MITTIQAPIPCRSLEWETYYFVQNKDNLKTRVAYLTNTYKTAANGKDNIVFIFAQDDDGILWVSENQFFDNYTVVGRVNRVIFE